MMGLVFRWYRVGIRREEAACRSIGSALGRLEQQAEVVAVYEIGVTPESIQVRGLGFQTPGWRGRAAAAAIHECSHAREQYRCAGACDDLGKLCCKFYL